MLYASMFTYHIIEKHIHLSSPVTSRLSRQDAIVRLTAPGEPYELELLRDVLHIQGGKPPGAQVRHLLLQPGDVVGVVQGWLFESFGHDLVLGQVLQMDA
jgi:hypothetical protein